MAAYNLTLSPSTFISFRLLCNFSSDLRGRRINVQGYLNNELAVECSPFDIVNLGPIYIQQFSFVNRRDCPVSYTGGYTWNLVAGTTVFATSPMLTSLELYTVASPLPSLWASYGVSVNLLRQYAAPWATHTTKWVLADFYRFIVTRIFGGTFRYDTVIGDYHFLKPTSIISGLGGGFMLDEYFRDLEAAKVVAVNWYDLAGIVQIVHSLYPNYKNGAWIYMSKFGWITTTNIKGYGPCNNRFFENTTYNSDRIASVDPPQLPWPPGFRRRSPFANHAFILAPTATPNVSCVLDATGGPHIGNESLETYINTAINRGRFPDS
ncbi:hypothetical protein K439DRAFT_1109714 [Ramaria rubella]|nr:hypothetical protein K439DRAFT_1109714 [Ramaria rubella]